MSFLKGILGNGKILEFLQKIDSIKNPEFKMGDFVINGEKWTGFMVREKKQ